jgi:lysophospholipase L1-like esterase
MKLLTRLLAAVAIVLSGCGEAPPDDGSARILAMGDSLMASNKLAGKAIADILERDLGEPVVDRSVPGAAVLYALPVSGQAGLSIPKQYRAGKWDWIVVNGGGNDLWLGCGCVLCKGKMERLISPDGRRGAIPGMLSDLRQTGAQVIYVGYLRSPGLGSPIEHCRDEGDELERRLARLAAIDSGLHFVSLADLVPEGDASYHAIDMIHPSAKASAAISGRVAAVIRQ